MSGYRVSGTGSLIFDRLFKCNEPIPAKQWNTLSKKEQEKAIKDKKVLPMSMNGEAIRGAVKDLTLPPLKSNKEDSGAEASGRTDEKVDTSGKPGADTDPTDEKFQKKGNNVSPFNIDPETLKRKQPKTLRAMLMEICTEHDKQDIIDCIEDMDKDSLIMQLSEDFEPTVEK